MTARSTYRQHSLELQLQVCRETRLGGLRRLDAQRNDGRLEGQAPDPIMVAPAEEPAPAPQPTFIPLALPASAVEGEIQIELQRAGTTIKIVWPAAAARDCAAWLREWLR